MNLISTLPLLACAFSAANYTTYIGDTYTYNVYALTTDSNGNTYATGSRNIISTSPGIFLTDVFVTKIDSNGNVTRLAAFGGKGSDMGAAIALDGAGNIFIVGTTSSPDFPLSHALQDTVAAPEATVPLATGFLTKLAPDGSILYSTYLGGTTGQSGLNAVAVDSNGNVYVTGSTAASDYPHTPGLPAGPIGPTEATLVTSAWFARISADGSKILYAGAIGTGVHSCTTPGSSCFLSPIFTTGAAIAVDAAGNAYIAGNTGGILTGTAGALIASGGGGFIAKVNAAGTGLSYLTLLRGSAAAIATDSAGDVYITGTTANSNFPVTTGAFQTSLPGKTTNPSLGPPPAAFVAKLNHGGTAMIWATYLGGSSGEAADALAVDASGNVWVSGRTGSSDFPITVGAPNGPNFLSEFNPSGTAIRYSARFVGGYLGAPLVFDNQGSLHGAGAGTVSSFPADSPPYTSSSAWLFGIGNAITPVVSMLVAPVEVISIYGLNLGPSVGASAQVSNSLLPNSLAGVQVLFNGRPAPLLYVSATQINAVVPFETTLAPTAHLQITASGGAVLTSRVGISSGSGGEVFTNPQGYAAALNQDGTINSAANPAHPGSIVTIWANDAGSFSDYDGFVATSAMPYPYVGSIVDAHATAATITYYGAAPGLVNGITQINFKIPDDAITNLGSGPPRFYLNGPPGKPVFGYGFSLYVSQ